MTTDFERAYTEQFRGVYKYVFSLCRNETVAEEITQEAFCKALERMDRFRGECSLYTWLCQIARNTYFTWAKRQKRLVPEGEGPPIRDEGPDPEDRLLDRENARRLHRKLHGLSEPYKEVFTLRVFGELPFAQIGELFGKSDSWARLVFYRAKKELRRGFDEHTL